MQFPWKMWYDVLLKSKKKTLILANRQCSSRKRGSYLWTLVLLRKNICDALHNLVRYVQFKKLKKTHGEVALFYWEYYTVLYCGNRTISWNAYVMFWVIWYHLHYSKNVKNIHERVLLLVKLQKATLLKVTLLRGCFLHFLNCTNGTKSRNAPHMNNENNIL